MNDLNSNFKHRRYEYFPQNLFFKKNNCVYFGFIQTQNDPLLSAENRLEMIREGRNNKFY